MDPKAALQAAERALKNKDWETAYEHYDAYRGWRDRGGFEPYKGADTAAKKLFKRIRALQEKQNVSPDAWELNPGNPKGFAPREHDYRVEFWNKPDKRWMQWATFMYRKQADDVATRLKAEKPGTRIRVRAIKSDDAPKKKSSRTKNPASQTQMRDQAAALLSMVRHSPRKKDRQGLLHSAEKKLDAYKARFGTDATYSALEDKWAQLAAKELNPKGRTRKAAKKSRSKKSSVSVRSLVAKALK